jgi:hypothetical protein
MKNIIGVKNYPEVPELVIWPRTRSTANSDVCIDDYTLESGVFCGQSLQCCFQHYGAYLA